MLRRLLAYALGTCIVLAGLSLASARGQDPVVGAELVICSGTTFTTIVLGADGQPVEKSAPCPDGTALFAAVFSLPVLPLPARRMQALSATATPGLAAPRPPLTASARSPPELI